MKLTSRSELALKAMIELAKAPAQDKPGLSTTEIAQRCEASVHFVGQVMLILRRKGMVVSRRGRKGGYRLKRDPADVSIGEIFRVLGGELGPAPCANPAQPSQCAWCSSPCQLTPLWLEVSAAIATILDSRTLEMVVAEGSSAAPPDDQGLIPNILVGNIDNLPDTLLA